MIPSLVARELKDSIVEYLVTTFALSDDEAYRALTDFLLDENDGIFRGPYLRVRLPFVDAPDDVDFAVNWTPSGFRPYAHQLVAWQRLAGRGHIPKPTLITTGTGSGKSEAFLVPAIDHAIWARNMGQLGIKALLLYPMNALVADQERRIAAMLADPEARASGVRGGVWIGDDGSTRSRRDMDESHLISDPAALQDNPPDILLTNYKMLDRLLLNSSRQRLWAANTKPHDDHGGWEQPLTYLVLDEFHTYDGAQGTDVAMLLRRLGHRLGTAKQTSPLGNVACVGTSATLGSSPTAIADMCGFASRVFGTRFDATAVVAEHRRAADDVCGDIDFSLPVPAPADLIALNPHDVDNLALAFTGVGFDNSQQVGDRLVRHRLTVSLLRTAADRPRRWPDAVATIAQQVPEWGTVLADSPDLVDAALERFVALVSRARGRTRTGEARPLFSVEVQVWLREVTRLKRAVSPQPSFRWADSPNDDHAALDLPSVYCTSCGRSGWLGVANRAGGQQGAAIERLVYDETDPYQVSVRDRERTRTMLRANPDEPDILWLDVDTGQVQNADTEQRTRVPVLVAGMTGADRTEEARDDAARRQQCPSCGTRDAIRFLGSRVTTLASVGITQMFGSDHVADDERKLLAFTDSVQDASHRAAFFSGRTHRFNLRATLSAALQSKGRVPLPGVADVVLTRAANSDQPLDDLFSLVPPDLLWEAWLTAAWEAPETPRADEARSGIAERLAFDAVLEAGLRSRLGRTLETTGTAIAEVLIAHDERSNVTDFAIEAIQANTGRLFTAPEQVQTWIAGVLERLRVRGGIYHPFLDRYLAEHGNRWWIWGGGHPLAPKFPKGISAPAFFASAPSDDLDPISGSQTWPRLWSRKVLGIAGAQADRVFRDLLHILTQNGILEKRRTNRGQIWGLPADRVEFVDNAPVNNLHPSTELRCNLCAHRHYSTPERFTTWTGKPCLRLRCPGQYEPAPTRPTNYYRQLYRTGRIRRVVAAEHTGMLTRKRRERIETRFKNGGRPDAPNVLAATPTLELGIDIGDLSAVMLTAVPPNQANYVQRVGRAGRTTGNAFVTTFAEGDPRSLYFLHDPELMIAGDIAAPSCYLDAIEILRRQYTAFLVDEAARRDGGSIPSAGEMPRIVGQTASTGMQPGGWLSEILDAGRNPDMVARFVGLFGNQLAPSVAERLAWWAATGMRTHFEQVLERWQSHLKTLANQRDRLRERERPLAALKHPTDEDTETLGRIVAELRYVAGRISRVRNQDTLGALEALGLLPNYTLFDETVSLEVSLWRPNTDHDPAHEQSRRFIVEASDYARPASIAIRELAPGNYFYVDAHRVRVDAIDNGTEHEPAHTLWRFCPSCAWASTDATATVNACPRCGTDGVKDQGSLLTVLPIRSVSSTERETTARVSDDSDDRDWEWHEVVTTIDIDPTDITAAHLHTKTVFGVESARAARIRYLNLGLHASRGGLMRQVRINSYDTHASLFRVCRHCGGVFGIRGDARDDHDPNHHRTWCKVRSGARRERWDHLALVHELVTEAVRILLPVAEFEAQERILSFKAALLLGLRDSFGGDPSHLRVLQTDFPAPGPGTDTRNRFVVVHDTVPGGTGYLPRLADPERLRTILDRSVELITTCECQTRGKPGCHRCLYTAVNRHEIPLVSRGVALEVLDEILTDWHMKPADKGTITGVNLSTVRQSELERMFKTLLHRWSTDGPATVTSKPDPAQANRTRFAVRFHDGPHWEVREQVNLAHHGTRPDFYATRIDTSGTAPIAIYLDGWEYHGADQDQVDQDSARRASIRAAGTSVWALTWHDVKVALTAVSQGDTVPATLPLPNSVRHRARQGAEHAYGSAHGAFEALNAGAFEQLMLHLRYPEPDAWQALAMTIAIAAGQGSPAIPVNSVVDATDQAARHETISPARNETDIAAMTWGTSSGLPAATILHRHVNLPRVVLTLDTASEAEKARWTEWLHMANMHQHLGQNAVLSTTRTYMPEVVAQPAAEPESEARPTALDLLVEVFDEGVVPLAEEAIADGWIELVVDYPARDHDDTPIEVAWPKCKVGILPSGVTRPVTLPDWDLRTSDDWTVRELLNALSQRVG